MKTSRPSLPLVRHMHWVWSCLLLLGFGIGPVSPDLIARPAVVTSRVDLGGSGLNLPIGSKLHDYLELPDGSLAITASTVVPGKEGLLVHCDPAGKPLSVASIDGGIAQAGLDSEGNWLLLQSFPGSSDPSTTVWKLSKVTLDGRLLWRVNLPNPLIPQLQTVDALGNSWLVERGTPAQRITQVAPSGQIQWSGALQGEPGAFATQTTIFDLQVDRLGNAAVAQLEVALQNGKTTVSLGVYRLSAAGKLLWSHRQETSTLGFDPAPVINNGLTVEGVRLAFDSQDRIYLAGSSFYWLGSFAYLTPPRLFVIAFDAVGQPRWTRHAEDPAWKLDPILTVNHADQLVVAASSPDGLISRTYDSEGLLVSQTALPLKLVDPGSNLVTPEKLKVDSQNNPLIYLTIGYPYRILHGPEITQTRLVKLNTSGDLVWSVTVTNLTLNEVGANNFEFPRVQLHPDGETRLLGNSQQKPDGGLLLDFGGIKSNGTPGHFKKIDVSVPWFRGATFELCTDKDGNAIVGSFLQTGTNGPSPYRLTKILRGGEKAWETTTTFWLETNRLELDVSLTGYSAVSYARDQNGFRTVRLFDPAGVQLWDATTLGATLLAVGVDGAVYVGKLNGTAETRRTILQKIGTSGTPIWTAELPTPEGWSDLHAWETVGGKLVVSWFDASSSATSVVGLSATGHALWNVSASLYDPVGIALSDGTFLLSGHSFASPELGDTPSSLTVILDADGQQLASNLISGSADQPSPAWIQASSRAALFRLKSAASSTAKSVFYVPQEALAARLIAESLCVPFEQDRHESLAEFAQSTVVGVGTTQVLGPIFTSQDEAYALVGGIKNGISRWELVGLAVRDGLTIQPTGVTVFWSGFPGKVVTVWRSTDLNQPWQPVRTMSADALGDLRYSEKTGAAPAVFFRWMVPPP